MLLNIKINKVIRKKSFTTTAAAPAVAPTCSESTSLCSETTGKGFVLPVLACVGVSVKSLSQAGQEVTM